MLTVMVYPTVKTLTMNPKVTPTCGARDRDQIMVRNIVRVVLVRKDTTETVLTNNPLFFLLKACAFIILLKNDWLLRARIMVKLRSELRRRILFQLDICGTVPLSQMY